MGSRGDIGQNRAVTNGHTRTYRTGLTHAAAHATLTESERREQGTARQVREATHGREESMPPYNNEILAETAARSHKSDQVVSFYSHQGGSNGPGRISN